jgi:hypothetical protein
MNRLLARDSKTTSAHQHSMQPIDNVAPRVVLNKEISVGDANKYADINLVRFEF